MNFSQNYDKEILYEKECYLLNIFYIFAFSGNTGRFLNWTTDVILFLTNVPSNLYFKGNAWMIKISCADGSIQKMGTSAVFSVEVDNEIVKNLLTLKENMFSQSSGTHKQNHLEYKVSKYRYRKANQNW